MSERTREKTREKKPLAFGSRTDIGCVRTNNEDNLLATSPLFAVADGMGGHAAGEVASEIAVRTLEQAQIQHPDTELLRAAVCKANEAIIEGYHVGLGRPGMGTTLTAAVIENDRLLIAQVGDSRAYLLQGNKLRQVTRDHSLMEEMISAGQLTAAEARVHPQRSVITRVLGNEPGVEPDIYELEVRNGDRLLLCSDGLSGMLESSEISAILQTVDNPQQAADALIDAAREAGGLDNITAIVVDITNADEKVVKRKRRRFKWGVAIFALVFVLLVAGTIGGIYTYAQNSAFLIEENGYVVIYRGLPGDVLGVELKWREEVTDVKTSKLAPTFQENVKAGIPMKSLDEAYDTVAELEKLQAR
jgi:protein phosphatase